MFQKKFINNNYLTEQEWSIYIDTYLEKIENTKTGRLLINELNDYIRSGLTIEITNKDNSKKYQYPFMKYCSSKYYKIVIPDIPYFTNVEVFDNRKLDSIINYPCDINDPIIHSILDFNILPTKFDTIKYKMFISYQFQPYSIILAHELIHILRKLKNKNKSFEEEEGTIYGINNNCLIINDTIITENQIRKDFGLLPRVSHNSQELFIYDVPQFFSKRDEYNKTICKQMFFN